MQTTPRESQRPAIPGLPRPSPFSTREVGESTHPLSEAPTHPAPPPPRRRERGYALPAATRLRVLEALTVLVPAVCAGIYETARHSFLANEFSNGVGTAVAVAIVLALSYAFARASFGIIHRMEARLVERNRRLHALSQDARRVATLEERERLAREIHDGVAQVIATLLVRVDTIESLVARGRTAEAGAELRDLRASGDLANVEVREAIAGLRANPLPGADGLADALRRYVEEFGARTGVEATFHARLPSVTAHALPAPRGASHDVELRPGHELHLMRVAIEALTNVRKHARATRVSVTLTAPQETGFREQAATHPAPSRGDGPNPSSPNRPNPPSPNGPNPPSPPSLRGKGGTASPSAVATEASRVHGSGAMWSLDIVDDGVGFDPEPIASGAPTGPQTPPRRRHFGLAMMRERVTALGGTCTVTSSIGSGTSVHVFVPSSHSAWDDDEEGTSSERAA